MWRPQSSARQDAARWRWLRHGVAGNQNDLITLIVWARSVGIQSPGERAAPDGVGDVPSAAHHYSGDLPRTLERVVAIFEHTPEGLVLGRCIAREIVWRHAERKDVHGNAVLAANEGLARQGIHLLHIGVGDRIASGRRALAMNHQRGAGSAMAAIELVGETEIEGQVEIRVRIHLLRRDDVEPLGRLLVAFDGLGAEISRPGADRIGPKMLVAAVVVPLPDLELGVLLEDADEDWLVQPQATAGKIIESILR